MAIDEKALAAWLDDSIMAQRGAGRDAAGNAAGFLYRIG